MPCNECGQAFDREPAADGYLGEVLRHHRDEHDHFQDIDLDID
jgi:hypothetical protein